MKKPGQTNNKHVTRKSRGLEEKRKWKCSNSSDAILSDGAEGEAGGRWVFIQLYSTLFDIIQHYKVGKAEVEQLDSKWRKSQVPTNEPLSQTVCDVVSFEEKRPSFSVFSFHKWLHGWTPESEDEWLVSEVWFDWTECDAPSFVHHFRNSWQNGERVKQSNFLSQ